MIQMTVGDYRTLPHLSRAGDGDFKNAGRGCMNYNLI